MRTRVRLSALAYLLIVVSLGADSTLGSEPAEVNEPAPAESVAAVEPSSTASDTSATPRGDAERLEVRDGHGAWQYGLRARPNGIPRGARLRALRQIEAMERKAAARRAATPVELPANSIDGDTWLGLGPAPAYEGQAILGCGNCQSQNVDVSGRATSIAVNPDNQADVWLGTANGGVWHSTNGGVNWRVETDQQPSLAIGALALDDCDAGCCRKVYAGTGENAIRRDTYYGTGLLVRELAGGCSSTPSWTLKGGELFEFGSIQNVVLDPETTPQMRRLYITVSSGVTASASHATITAPEPASGYGIFKSENGGDDFMPLSIAGTDGERPTDLEMSPANNNLLFAGFLEKGIYRGFRDDENDPFTWCPLNPGNLVPGGCPDPELTGLPRPTNDPDIPDFDHVEIAIAEQDADVLYALFGHCPDKVSGNCESSIYRSGDGGETWTRYYGGTSSSSGNSWYRCPKTYSRYTHALAIDPTDKNRILLGGISVCAFDASEPAPDPGPEHFTRLAPTKTHADQHAIVFADANTIYLANDGGFYFSDDGGSSWTSGNDDLQITEFHSITPSPLPDNSVVFGGTQDNGTLRWSLNPKWRHVDYSDGGDTIQDHADPDTVYTTYYRTQNSPRRSRSGGPSNGSFDTFKEGISASDPVAFYPPYEQDPSCPHPLYFGTARLYKRDAYCDFEPGELEQLDLPCNFSCGLEEWTPVSPFLGCVDQDSCQDANEPVFGDIGEKNVITEVAVAPSDGDVVYVGYYDGRIFASDANGGPCDDISCWPTVAGQAEGLPAAAVTSIAVDPDDANIAYATFSGFGIGGHVFKTTTGGQSWAAKSDDLPDIPANTIAIEPDTAQNLWLGTDLGVFKSTDSGESWEPFNQGLPRVAVYDLAIDAVRERVYAGTHGRGAFVITSPYVTTLEGWVDGEIWDVPVFGEGFPPNIQSCNIELFNLGEVNSCADGFTDVKGGTVLTDDQGRLTTDGEGGQWKGKLVAWACNKGDCVGFPDPVPIDACPELAKVTVNCNGVIGIGTIIGCPQQLNPPSNYMTILGLTAEEGGAETREFDLTASVQSGIDGSTRSLCTVTVPFDTDETTEAVLARTREAVNDSETCRADSVEAVVSGFPEDPGEFDEDPPPVDPRLSLRAGDVSGGQLITSLHVGPGDGSGLCFDAEALGVYSRRIIMIMRIGFETADGGAQGGTVRIVERSSIGECSVSVATNPGDSAVDVADKLATAFVSDPLPGCPPEENPRDIDPLEPGVLVSVMAEDLTICVDDPGVGFSLRPEELTNVHPFADAGNDETIECAGAFGAEVDLNGSGSGDPDSSPGTADDIIAYRWFEDFGEPGEVHLGDGQILPDVVLPIGAHRITLEVEDAAGLTAQQTVIKDIVDTTPPEISVSLDPTELWPPNHRMVDVVATVMATDLCSVPTVALASIGSNEPDNAQGNGDGNTDNDIQDAETGTADFEFRLRAERAGTGTGRIYTVIYVATDGSGNVTPEADFVVVPHNQAGGADPIELSVAESDAGSVVAWAAEPVVESYDVIRGELTRITETAVAINLGPVVCIEDNSTDETTSGREDPDIPVPGEAFFYLVEYFDGTSSGYGTESASKPRAPGAGACP